MLRLPASPGLTKMATEAKMRMMAYNLMERKMKTILEPQGGISVLNSITFDGTATQTGPDVIAELDVFMGNLALEDGFEEVRGASSMKVNVQAVRSIDTSGTETEQVERAKTLATVTSLKDAEKILRAEGAKEVLAAKVEEQTTHALTWQIPNRSGNPPSIRNGEHEAQSCQP